VDHLAQFSFILFLFSDSKVTLQSISLPETRNLRSRNPGILNDSPPEADGNARDMRKSSTTVRLQKMRNRQSDAITTAFATPHEVPIPQQNQVLLFVPFITSVAGTLVQSTFSGMTTQDKVEAEQSDLLVPITSVSDSLVQNTLLEMDANGKGQEKKPRPPVYPCPVAECASNSFRTTETMERHIRSCHGGELKFFCDMGPCASGFFTDVALQGHKARYHNNDSVLTLLCDICPSRFATKSSLNAHSRVVHAENPKRFVCEVCQKGYRLRTELQCHQYKMHRDLNPKKYTSKGLGCHICNFVSRTKNYLQVHIERKHPDSTGTVRYLNYKCPHCEFRTHSASALKVHVNGVHSVTKTFICNHCQSSCNNASSLAIHLKQHKE